VQLRLLLALMALAPVAACPRGGQPATGADAAGVENDAGVSPDGGSAEWRWVNPLTQGNTVKGLWGSSADDVWAVGGSSYGSTRTAR
jgi:hypothetical protein